jgi:spoIIIJ-associated protein
LTVEWVETTGRSVDEAKDAALDELGVDEQDAEFEVVEEPKVGLFGRLRNEARVRARVRPTAPRAKEDRRDRRRKKAPAGGNGGAPAPTGAQPEGEQSPAQAPQVQPKPQRSERPARQEQQQRRGPSRPRQEGSEVEEDVPLAEQGEVARQFLVGLMTELGATAEVVVREVDEDTIELVVEGDDLGTLIGPKGTTLTALQELTRTVVQRQTGGRNGRLLVDVSGYRQKRREALEKFTQGVAAAVLETGERKVLEPMHPADRKVVHDTANTIDGVRTISEGEEPRRRVVILPDAG